MLRADFTIQLMLLVICLPRRHYMRFATMPIIYAVTPLLFSDAAMLLRHA